ncbi:MAG: glycoside hydrolase family 5 protein [Bacteroidales bacterium]|nr:glycoside hydrolase family 5 protein [Bacteroidales bacterium]
MKKNLMILVWLIPAFFMNPITMLSQEENTMEGIWTEGNRFVKESGETILFQGVNFSDPHVLDSKGRWTRAHFEEAQKWGSNIIRLPVHPWAWRERGEESYLELLDRGVEWARELGLYIILDWHSIGNLKEEKFQNKGYITTLEETKNFWRAVSGRYAGEPAVAMYELFNEPTITGERFGEMTWAEWKAMNEEMIRLIREHHPRAVILVTGFDWGYDLTPVRTDPFDEPGIAYVSHPYPQKREAPWEEKWEQDWGFVAEDYALILTEIGFALADEKGVHVPVTGDETYGRAIVDYAAGKGISWVVWCFDPDWAPFMFTDWNYTPTRQGVFFKEVMTGGGN